MGACFFTERFKKVSNLPEHCNLIITGVGGQGNILAAKILAAAILRQGYEVTVGDVYGLSQRGGAVASHVRWQTGESLPPLVPQNDLDVLVAFEPMEGLRILEQFGSHKTKAVINATPIAPIGVQAGRFNYPDYDVLIQALTASTRQLQIVQATDAALTLGKLQVLNIVMLGALYANGYIGDGTHFIEDAIRNSVRSKFVELNIKAFSAGLQLKSIH